MVEATSESADRAYQDFVQALDRTDGQVLFTGVLPRQERRAPVLLRPVLLNSCFQRFLHRHDGFQRVESDRHSFRIPFLRLTRVLQNILSFEHLDFRSAGLCCPLK